MRFFLGLMLSFLLFSCSDQKTQYPALDLMKYGMPIKINAPAEAKIDMTDFGLMKDLTVIKDASYYLQIYSSDLISTDIAKIKAEKLSEVKSNPSFIKLIEENDNGFIFEKMRSDSTLNYDFRQIRIQGDKQYIFQTGLVGKFSESDVRQMYLSVQ